MDRPPDSSVATVARALRAQADVRSAAEALGRGGIPTLLLKGPDLQARLYGRPTEYVSTDVDILIPPRHWSDARRVLTGQGWRFAPDNGVLWWLSRAAAFDRAGFRLDVHWGLHAGHLTAWSLRPLERALWGGARPGPGAMLEPDPESLLVFLAVHAAGHRFERAQWVENVHRSASKVKDWPKVWRIARSARVEHCTRQALESPDPGTLVPILDGWLGRWESSLTWITRGHFLPTGLRDRIRGLFGEARVLARSPREASDPPRVKISRS
jgi:hypothetical protein